jgi:periplasmic protein CpxP/Spy
MKKVALVALVVGVGAAALTLTAFRHGFGHHRMSPEQLSAFVTDHVDDALDDLDATPAQRDRIHAVKDRLVTDGLALRDGGQGMHRAFLDEWKAASPDKARLHQLVDERVEAFRKVAHEAVDAGVEVHDVLTPEQRAKITKKAERHMGRVER